MLEGYGYIGFGGMIGWVDLEIGSVFGYVYNCLLMLLLFDIGLFVGLVVLLNSVVVVVCCDDFLEVLYFGVFYSELCYE